jgi:hypothetical protein
MGPYLLSASLSAQWYHDFLKIVLLGLPLAAKQRSWIQHHVCQWLNATYPGRWFGHRGPTAWPPWSPDLTPMDFFLRGHLKEHVYVVPLDYQRSHGKTSSSCDNGRCQHVKVCSREYHVVHSRLPWNGWRLLWIPNVTTRRPWFDHLIACTIWQWRGSWKLNITGHMLYNIFDFFFNKESHYGQLVL